MTPRVSGVAGWRSGALQGDPGPSGTPDRLGRLRRQRKKYLEEKTWIEIHVTLDDLSIAPTRVSHLLRSNQ